MCVSRIEPRLRSIDRNVQVLVGCLSSLAANGEIGEGDEKLRGEGCKAGCIQRASQLAPASNVSASISV